MQEAGMDHRRSGILKVRTWIGRSSVLCSKSVKRMTGRARRVTGSKEQNVLCAAELPGEFSIHM